jgi:hypothetical protein
MAKTVITTNITASDIALGDLSGYTLPASGTATLSDLFQFSRLVEALDLRDYITSSGIVINDGMEDLSVQEALRYISYEDATSVQNIPIADPSDSDLQDGFAMRYDEGEFIFDFENFNINDLAGITVIGGNYYITNASGIQIPIAGNFLQLEDTPTTYSGHEGKILRVDPTGSGISFIPEHTHAHLVFTGHPNYNGEIRVLGWYIKTNDQPPNDGPYELSSGNPVQSLKTGYHSHWVMNVLTTSGVPFTVNVSGTSVHEDSGTHTEENEEITVTGTGYYQTGTSFMDASIFSILEAGKSCTMDIYKTTYWDAGNRDFILEGCRLEWEPDQINWDFNLQIYHLHHDGSIELIDDLDFDDTDEFPHAAAYEPGKYKRTNYNHFINGDNSEGIVVYLDQDSISNFYLELRYIMQTTTP